MANTTNQWLDIEMSLRMGSPITEELLRDSLLELIPLLDKEREISHLEERVSNLKNDIHDLENANESLQRQVDQFDNDELKDSLSEAQSKITVLEDQVEYLTQKNLNITRLNTKLEKELADNILIESMKSNYNSIVKAMKVLENELKKYHNA